MSTKPYEITFRGVPYRTYRRSCKDGTRHQCTECQRTFYCRGMDEAKPSMRSQLNPRWLCYSCGMGATVLGVLA
jgi:hypothetical protein